MSQSFTRNVPIDTDGYLSTNSDFLIPSQKAVKTYVDTGLSTKQAALVSGTNIKTLNGNSLLGSGDLSLTVFKQNTNTSLTGTTLKNVMFFALINAGTMQANDVLRILCHFTCTSNANAKTVEVYFNTTPNLSGTPVLIATRTLTSIAGSPIVRNVIFKNSLSSQGIMTNALQFANDENTTQGQVLISSDFALNQYIVVACQLANAGDTVTLNNIIGIISR